MKNNYQKQQRREKFTTELTNTIRNINTPHIPNKKSLEEIVQKYVRISNFA